MNGTVAPPSSRDTVASTRETDAPTSLLIRKRVSVVNMTRGKNYSIKEGWMGSLVSVLDSVSAAFFLRPLVEIARETLVTIRFRRCPQEVGSSFACTFHFFDVDVLLL